MTSNVIDAEYRFYPIDTLWDLYDSLSLQMHYGVYGDTNFKRWELQKIKIENEIYMRQEKGLDLVEFFE